jgi:hypothetical protein
MYSNGRARAGEMPFGTLRYHAGYKALAATILILF